MKKTITALIIVGVMLGGIVGFSMEARATDPICNTNPSAPECNSICVTNPDAPCCNTTSANQDFETQVRVAVNVVLGVAGLIAVAFIIYGGLKYTTSAGDAAKVTSAKNTILYAVIGLVVAGLAFAIVNFVIRGLRF